GGKNFLEAAPEIVAQLRLSRLFVRQIPFRFLRGCRHPRNCGNILGSRTTFAFVRAPKLNPINRQAGAQIKKAGAFWSVELARADGRARGARGCSIPCRRW